MAPYILAQWPNLDVVGGLSTNRPNKLRGCTVKKTGTDVQPKPKAEKYPIAQLLITSAYARTYKTGSKGFHGQAVDPVTGKKFTIIGAVENKVKAS